MCFGINLWKEKEALRVPKKQNSAAYLGTNTHKYESIPQLLDSLRCFPIGQHISQDVSHKCLYELAPAYLNNLLTVKPNRGIRSNDKKLWWYLDET